MAFSHFLLAVAFYCCGVFHYVEAAVAADAAKTCKEMDIRREWRTLSDEQQLDYVESIQCLTKSPSKHPIHSLPGIVSRYDDFVAAHIAMAPKTHYVGQFLPWHRYFLLTFERALREECKYDGPLPYWDWNLDVPPKGKWTESPVFNPDTGFGGNGPYEPTPASSLNSRKLRRFSSKKKRAQKAVSGHASTNNRAAQQEAFDRAKDILKVYRSTKAEIAAVKKQQHPLSGGTEFNFRPQGALPDNSSAPISSNNGSAPAPPPGADAHPGGDMAGMPGMNAPPPPGDNAASGGKAPPGREPGIQGNKKEDPTTHPPKKWLAGLAELGLDVSRGMPTDNPGGPMPPGMDGPEGMDDHGDMGGEGVGGMGNMTGMGNTTEGAGEGMGGHHHHPEGQEDGGLLPPDIFGSATANVKHYGGGCITDGIFADYNVTLGPGLAFDNNPHCIRRDFMTDIVTDLAADKIIKYIVNAPNYYILGAIIDPVHEVGHAGIGGYEGNMANLFSSLTDPIFWLHHGNMDRIWWSWQMGDLTTRLKDIESPEIDPTGANITTDYLIKVGFTGNVRPIKDIMDLRAWPWCRDYDSVYLP